MSKKIYGTTVGTTMSPAKAFEKVTEFCGVRILADGETVEDAPKDAGVIIDPNGSSDKFLSIDTFEQTTDDNGNNIITVTLTDGSKKTFVVVNGKDGNGIVSVVGNEDGSWTFTYEDGKEETVSNEAYMDLTELLGIL